MRLFSLTVLIPACASEARIVEDMERALYDSQAVIAVQLLATELLVHTFDEPTDTEPNPASLRHGDSCGCPCIERIGDEPPYVLTLDYDDDGCVPLTGLIPGSLTGHAVLEYDGIESSITFDGLEVGLGNPLSGTVAGEPPTSGPFAIQGDLTAGDHRVRLDTQTTMTEGEGLRFDGTATVGEDSEVVLEAVDLPWDEIAPPCPSPDSGLAVFKGGPKVSVDFTTPGGGLVTVSRRGRLSESIEYCSYRTDLF